MNHAVKIEARLAELNAHWRMHGWQATIDESDHRSRVRQNGIEFLATSGRMVLPICLNNGYYNRATVHRLVTFAAGFSRSVSFFFTDGPSKHNYLAMGKSLKEAERKCHRHFNRLRNFCESGVEALQSGNDVSFDLDLHRWTKIYKRLDWKREHAYLRELYRSNEAFRADVRSATFLVLERRIGKTEDLEQRTEIAIEYTLEELAFILIAPTRLAELENSKAGVGKIEKAEAQFSYIYYEPWPVMERLVDGYYDSIVRWNIGFCVLDIAVMPVTPDL